MAARRTARLSTSTPNFLHRQLNRSAPARDQWVDTIFGCLFRDPCLAPSALRRGFSFYRRSVTSLTDAPFPPLRRTDGVIAVSRDPGQMAAEFGHDQLRDTRIKPPP